MSSLSERVATLTLATFASLPRKSKPRIHPDGSREWIPCSGIVLASDANADKEILTCISVATGSKCLPVSAVSKCKGRVLHDSHAEVLALRALNHFFLSEIFAILQDTQEPYVSPFICFRKHDTNPQNEDIMSQRLFEIRRNISIWMYNSEAPCGDASMEILMAEKGNDVEPWLDVPSSTELLQGRGYFSALGKVRRKPSRGDAEPSLSKSCTDKLALKQVTSLLSFPASMFIASTENAYLSGLIVPPNKYSGTGFDRAFGSSGRLGKHSALQLPSTFRFRPFQTLVLPVGFETFAFAKPGAGEPAMKAGNTSALFIEHWNKSTMNIKETILGGVKQGFKPFVDDPKKASVVSRANLWQLAASIIDCLQQGCNIPPDVMPVLENFRRAKTYGELKMNSLHVSRRVAKEIVTRSFGEWPQNVGDEDWSL